MVGRWHSALVAPEAAAFAREVVARAAPHSPERAKALLFAASRLSHFALAIGLGPRPEELFGPAFIERFIVANERTFSAPTRRTLRTNCRALGRALEAYPEPRPVPLPRERAKKPYTASEISSFLALAEAQPTPARANRASALVCLGAGAGLVGPELAGVRGTDIAARAGGVVVEVAGARARAVPVLARFHGRLLSAASFSGAGYVIGGTERSRRNVASGLVFSLCGGTGRPRLELARLRATWLSEVAALIGLPAFMAAAGFDISQRLGDIVARLPRPPEAEAVALLGGQGAEG